MVQGMGHIGNRDTGDNGWGTGVWGIWAMRPTGGMGYRGMSHMGNSSIGGMGYKGHGPHGNRSHGQWGTWAMGPMGNGAHGAIVYMGYGVQEV